MSTVCGVVCACMRANRYEWWLELYTLNIAHVLSIDCDHSGSSIQYADTHTPSLLYDQTQLLLSRSSLANNGFGGEKGCSAGSLVCPGSLLTTETVWLPDHVNRQCRLMLEQSQFIPMPTECAHLHSVYALYAQITLNTLTHQNAQNYASLI